MKNYIPLEKCEDKYLYRIRSRNLSFGVFNKIYDGFIGIRHKFYDKFLFTELHYDTGPPFGTVFPDKKLNKLPDDIELKEYLHNIDIKTGREVKFIRPLNVDGVGWFFVDTNENSKDIVPESSFNEKLFKWLEDNSLLED